eukprot:gnl/Dysnectes_brevis/4052_a5307_783.p1 GENE.gnl/Dysnectes_brevis/4052_a5307_783~~gnl/Dysnectes_brevis/4052_a5307_783.p1  ORF type:complete len:1041 (-),score=287.83 gnl/Dysnectes_brevis/4052_a5307_783:69-3191(-)
MSTRLSSMKTNCVAKELKHRLLNCRFSTIYNITKSQFLLKFIVTGSAIVASEICPASMASLQKRLVIIEPGFRIHTTSYEWEKTAAVSQFSMLARTELKNTRISNVFQLGFDRIVIITLTGREKTRYLVSELYGKGNLLILDEAFTILATSSRYADTPLGAVYQREPRPRSSPVSTIDFRETLEEALERAAGRRGRGAAARGALNQAFDIGGLGSAILKLCGFGSNTKAKAVLSSGEDRLELLRKTIKAVCLRVEDVLSAPAPCKGRIYYSPPVQLEFLVETTPQEKETLLKAARIKECQPMHLPSSLADLGIEGDATLEELESEEFPSFLDALDAYFTLAATARAARVRQQAVSKALGRAKHLSDDVHRRSYALRERAEEERCQGRALEQSHVEAELVITTLREAVRKGRQWDRIQKWLSQQQDGGSGLVNLISELRLDRNEIVLRLPLAPQDVQPDTTPGSADTSVNDTSDGAVSEDDDDLAAWDSLLREDRGMTAVTCDLSLGALANARKHFQAARDSDAKAGRTDSHAAKVSADASKRADETVVDTLQQTKQSLVAFQRTRRPLWFERFRWFISSDGLLVLSGKDAQSNELLVRRVLEKNDLFLHADAHGAAVTLIKAPHGAKEDWIPPQQTLLEAGCAAGSHSRAWDDGSPCRSYFVRASQVSKSAPSGLSLPTGSFMVRGQRRYLPPQPLHLGAAVIWRHGYRPAVSERDPWRIAYGPNGAALTAAAAAGADLWEEGKGAPGAGAPIVRAMQGRKTKQHSSEQQQKKQRRQERKEAKKERRGRIRAQQAAARARRALKDGLDPEAIDIAPRSPQMHCTPELPVASTPLMERLCLTCGRLQADHDCPERVMHEKQSSLLVPPSMFTLGSSPFEALGDQAPPARRKKGPAGEDAARDDDDEPDADGGSSTLAAVHALTFERPGESVEGLPPLPMIMIGPSTALSRAPLRVGLVPGHMKRGKAIKLIMRVFSNQRGPSAPSTLELHLLGGINQDLLVPLLPAMVTVSGHGVGRIIASQKQDARKQRAAKKKKAKKKD